MLKITRDFYQRNYGENIFVFSTVVNGELLKFEFAVTRCQFVPIAVIEREARRAFERKIFEGAFRE